MKYKCGWEVFEGGNLIFSDSKIDTVGTEESCAMISHVGIEA